MAAALRSKVTADGVETKASQTPGVLDHQNNHNSGYFKTSGVIWEAKHPQGGRSNPSAIQH